MTRTLQVGDLAPNFDMASTEDVVLMLCDEVPRTPVLLYFFSSVESEPARAALAALNGKLDGFARAGVKLFGVSGSKLDELKSLQKELGLRFPLLHDDRDLSAAYGLETGDDVEDRQFAVLVGRGQRVLWLSGATASVDDVASAVLAAGKGVSSSVNYPRKVINRLVDRWVN